VRLARYPQTAGISLALGVLFAAAYDGLLALEFAGIHLGIDGPGTIYGLFVGAAVLAGMLAGARTQRLGDSIMTAVWALVIGTAIWSVGLQLLNASWWGSTAWYQFWLGDGAVDDFRRSGSADLAAFLLQDLQGALFFHQVLSVVLGVLGGIFGGGIGLGATRLWRRTSRPAPSQG
jgi:hypothetical protein